MSFTEFLNHHAKRVCEKASRFLNLSLCHLTFPAAVLGGYSTTEQNPVVHPVSQREALYLWFLDVCCSLHPRQSDLFATPQRTNQLLQYTLTAWKERTFLAIRILGKTFKCRKRKSQWTIFCIEILGFSWGQNWSFLFILQQQWQWARNEKTRVLKLYPQENTKTKIGPKLPKKVLIIYKEERNQIAVEHDTSMASFRNRTGLFLWKCFFFIIRLPDLEFIN